jgi:hypothetical protein
VLMVVVFTIGLLVIRLTGGDLHRLNDLRIRGSLLALAAVITQVVIISVWPDGWRAGHLAINLATYAAIGLVIWINRRIPWLWVVGLGAASNTVAIALNDGVMPASATALSVAHITTGPGFVNSAAVVHPRVAFLGDIIPTPGWLPLHNVASIGDLLIIGGALLLVARQTRRPRVAPA